ncbi:hypothetical protein, partial [Erwinia amylovora]|uniref:hypothetical protein n=1 Tax=Erwinia amylovora TaxID=552 RepID=UPI0020C019C9|nr:hypothetical protein [Erwinia amylovora]
GAAVACEIVVFWYFYIPADTLSIWSAVSVDIITRSAHFPSSLWPIAATAAGTTRLADPG